MPKNVVKVAYICDTKRDCGRFEACQLSCFHTQDRMHTANGIIQNVKELDTDRFEKVGTWNETDFYVEVLDK